MTGELVRYDTMCRAINAAYEIDEVKDIRNKAIALEHYARQANNVEAEQRCCEIRLRAERKANQLYDAGEKARVIGPGRGKQSPETGPRFNDAPSLADYGITKQQMSDWRKLGRLPEDKFEEAISVLDRPSRDEVVDYVSGEPKPSPVGDAVLWLWGRLRDFQRHGLLTMDAKTILSTATPEMRDDIREIITLVINWLTLVETEL